MAINDPTPFLDFRDSDAFDVVIIDAVADCVDDNTDVRVILPDGRSYVATFFTIKNIERLLREYAANGECAFGQYFWSSEMIVIKSLDMSSIRTAVADLLRNGEFHKAFRKI